MDKLFKYKSKILIDTIVLLSPVTGIGRYTYEISKRINENNIYETSFFYGYYSKNLINVSSNSNIKRIKKFIVKNKLLKYFIRKISSIISRMFSPDYDIYWQPNFIPNSGVKARYIITSVHDFSFIEHKNYHVKNHVEYFNNFFYKNIYKSDYIITFSQFTKQEIIEKLNFPKEAIHVIYHGVDHNLFKIYKNIKLDFELPNKFILAVGSIEPRKNLIGLLEAYKTLNIVVKKQYKLVLVGFKGWNNQEIMDIINSNKENIYYLGYLSNIDLAKVYNLATIFVYPSFYEGFGLPPLEAMACGTPVLASKLTSIPEICDNAAIYINPYNVKDIKDNIELLLRSKSLQTIMIERGLKRVQQFTWEKSVQEHNIVFQKVLK